MRPTLVRLHSASQTPSTPSGRISGVDFRNPSFFLHIEEIKKKGLLESFKTVWKMNILRPNAKFVGQDVYGNKYYEDVNHLIGRNRFVEYATKNIDASQIPSEWHTWLHNTIEIPPNHPKFSEFMPKYQRAALENKTGTTLRYLQPNHFLNRPTKNEPVQEEVEYLPRE